MRRNPQSGQAAVEMAFLIPILLMIMFGAFQLARVFYVYHQVQKQLRVGAELLSHANSVNYCDVNDPTVVAAKNLILYGNLQGQGGPNAAANGQSQFVVDGLNDPTAIQIIAEQIADPSTVNECTNQCDCGGVPPDYITVTLPNGFLMPLTFPGMNFTSGTSMKVAVSVRMPVTGG